MAIVEEKDKQYFNEINIMRGIAAFCVVIGHSFDATDVPTVLGFLKSFVYCFHMPAFFFISGFLVRDYKLDCITKIGKIKSKAKRLMIPYLFLTLVTIGLKVVFGAFARNPLNYSTLIMDVLIGRNNPNGGLWFLYALFIISAVGVLLNGVDIRVIFAGAFLLYILNSFVFFQHGYILGFFLEYAWFYFGGTFIRKYFYSLIRNSKKVSSILGKIITVFASVAYIAVAFVRIYCFEERVFSCVVTLSGVFLLFIIAVQIESVNRGKIWMILGNYGMDIYMIGYYVQQVIYVLCGKIFGMDYLLYSWLMCIFGLIASIIISKYIVRRNKILSLLILGQ